MRTLAVALTLLIMTPICGLGVIFAELLGVKHRRGSFHDRMARLWASSLCKAAGVKIRLHNAERMSGEAARVYVGNHVSWYDVFAMASVIPSFTFIAKSELEKIPFFGRAARAGGIIFIERATRKSAFESYRMAAKQVEWGRSVVIFPEGTRGFTYELRPFKKGPFVFAIAAGVPIVPVIIHGARDVHPKGRISIRSGTVDIHFLEPIETAGYDYEERAELMQKTWYRMADAFRELYGIETRHSAISVEAGTPEIRTSFL